MTEDSEDQDQEEFNIIGLAPDGVEDTVEEDPKSQEPGVDDDPVLDEVLVETDRLLVMRDQLDIRDAIRMLGPPTRPANDRRLGRRLARRGQLCSNWSGHCLVTIGYSRFWGSRPLGGEHSQLIKSKAANVGPG